MQPIRMHMCYTLINRKCNILILNWKPCKNYLSRMASQIRELHGLQSYKSLMSSADKSVSAADAICN